MPLFLGPYWHRRLRRFEREFSQCWPSKKGSLSLPLSPNVSVCLSLCPPKREMAWVRRSFPHGNDLTVYLRRFTLLLCALFYECLAMVKMWTKSPLQRNHLFFPRKVHWPSHFFPPVFKFFRAHFSFNVINCLPNRERERVRERNRCHGKQ